MRIVVDTNVLVSGVVNPGRVPGLVIEAAARGDVTLVTTAKLWSELEQTLGYTRIREFIVRHGGEDSVPVAIARLQTLAPSYRPNRQQRTGCLKTLLTIGSFNAPSQDRPTTS